MAHSEVRIADSLSGTRRFAGQEQTSVRQLDQTGTRYNQTLFQELINTMQLKLTWIMLEERRRNMPDEDCPPGMTLLPEEERVSTLAILTKSLAECKKQLGQMPLLIETHGQVKRKQVLDDKMRELEEAVKIFSRTKVFVRDD